MFIDTSCSTGIIQNTVMFVHHTPIYTFEILPQWFEVATTTAFNLMHKNPKAAVAIFNDSIGEAETKGNSDQLQQHDGLNLWFWPLYAKHAGSF